MLGGIYCGAIFGGSISAILIHTPGTPASAATAIDGYAMTLKGKAGKALGTACTASFFGGLLSCLSLYFFAPILAELAMKFGSPEYFWLSLFGLTIIAGINSDSMILGLMSGAFGLVLSTIGMDLWKEWNGSCSTRMPFIMRQYYRCLDWPFLPIPGFHPCGKSHCQTG